MYLLLGSSGHPLQSLTGKCRNRAGPSRLRSAQIERWEQQRDELLKNVAVSDRRPR